MSYYTHNDPFAPLVLDEDKVRISNERLWEIECQGESIDDWLRDNVGYGKYNEWIAITSRPHRCFSFTNEEDRILFMLKWL